MGLQSCDLKLDHEHKEIKPHGTIDFPCAGYLGYYSDKPEGILPWHWHEEIEIVYVKTGSIKIHVPSQTYLLNEGDCLIINSNTSHYAAATPWCELQSLVFHPSLITGSTDSAFAVKYILPLTSCPSFRAHVLAAGHDQCMIDSFVAAYEAQAQNLSGYEFIVRNHLSGICFFLFQQYEPMIVTADHESHSDDIRIRQMLDFIHCNFADIITLSDIAKAADIGERECLRCFQRTIQLSPIQYLLKYRVMQGAAMLVSYPAVTISEISALCGFESPSNFSKIFKRFYNRSPREHRCRANRTVMPEFTVSQITS